MPTPPNTPDHYVCTGLYVYLANNKINIYPCRTRCQLCLNHIQDMRDNQPLHVQLPRPPGE